MTRSLWRLLRPQRFQGCLQLTQWEMPLMAWEKPPGGVLDTMRWCGRRRAAAAPIRPDGGSACCCFAGCFALLRHRNEVIALADSCLLPKTSALAATSSVFHTRRSHTVFSQSHTLIYDTDGDQLMETGAFWRWSCPTPVRNRGKVCYNVKVKWAMAFSAHQGLWPKRCARVQLPI